ncbi:MAG: TenA family transcriptional regulator [Chitinophagales bacterium]
MNLYFKELEDSLREGIDKILKHPFLKRIEEASLTKLQLQYFAKQYSIYCYYFPRFLAATAANIPYDETRMPIIENLWEEHGEGKMSKSHRMLYNNFAASLGVTVKELKEAQPLASTQTCVSTLFNLCLNGSFIESLGALGPGTEFFTSEEYSIIANGLAKYDFLTDKDIEFWTVHISLDEAHYSEMVDILVPYIDTEENRRLVKEGAEAAIELELSFWDGLEHFLA